MTPDIAEHAREILRQYNEAGYNSCASLTFHGPHYVTFHQGTFMLRPFGAWAKYRHSFRVTPDYDFGRLEESIWIFNVL
jgi:hypothetical protein